MMADVMPHCPEAFSRADVNAMREGEKTERSTRRSPVSQRIGLEQEKQK